MQIRDILQLTQGSVVELSKFAGEPLEVLVNEKLIARGEVVVVNEKFGVRLTDIISPTERIEQLPDASSELSLLAYENNFPAVGSAFLKLTTNQRTVLNLAYVEGLTQTEMAEALKQPLGTIKTWVRTALGVMRGEYKRQIVCEPGRRCPRFG